MHPVDAFAQPALILVGTVLSMLVVWEQWPRVRWWTRRRVRRWRIEREAWLAEQRRARGSQPR